MTDEKRTELFNKGRKWAAGMVKKCSKKNCEEMFITCGLYGYDEATTVTKNGKRLNEGLREFYRGAMSVLGENLERDKPGTKTAE